MESWAGGLHAGLPSKQSIPFGQWHGIERGDCFLYEAHLNECLLSQRPRTEISPRDWVKVQRISLMDELKCLIYFFI